VIAFSGGFHGRTYMTMALTGKVAPYKIGFGPFPGSVYHVPYPSDLHGISTQDSLDAIERLFKSDIEAKQVAAIIFEPVQGEGGFNVAPKELVAAIRRLCDEHGIVMIADEVQSGFARTGKLFAMDHYADKPDLMTMAKSLAGGMPLSGVVGNANIMDAPAPGGLGGTYAGNPLAVAAAHAVLNIIDKESLCERANQLGQRLKNTLIDAKESVPAIAAVRGLGSMIAVEFNDPQTGEPSAAIAQKIQQRALAQGLLLLTCGAYGNVIRFLYPLPSGQYDVRKIRNEPLLHPVCHCPADDAHRATSLPPDDVTSMPAGERVFRSICFPARQSLSSCVPAYRPPASLHVPGT
jgi:4-aminobutyrate aminotransferase